MKNKFLTIWQKSTKLLQGKRKNFTHDGETFHFLRAHKKLRAYIQTFSQLYSFPCNTLSKTCNFGHFGIRVAALSLTHALVSSYAYRVVCTNKHNIRKPNKKLLPFLLRLCSSDLYKCGRVYDMVQYYMDLLRSEQ